MKRGGFSLFEMIVVLGIMSIATGLGAAVFLQMNENWERIRRTAELEARAQAIFSAIRADAENILPERVTGVAVAHPVTQFYDDDEFDAAPLTDGSLELPVYAALGADQRVGAARVRFSIDRSSPSPKLIRTTGGLYGGAAQGNASVVAEGVYGFAAEPIPGAARTLRLSVLLADERQPDDQIARTAVVPLRVE